MLQLEQKVKIARSELDKVQLDRIKLQNKVHMLYNDSLDPDLLDEQARRFLGYAGKDEVVYFLED